MRLAGGERLQLLGDFALGSVKCSKEDATAAFEIVGHNGTTVELEVQRRFHQFGRHFEQLFGEGNELFERKTAMPFIHRFCERVGDPGTYADERCLFDAELGRDLVGRAEADAADIAGQPVRVLRDQPNGIGAVSFVNAHRARRADAIAVQEQHDLTDDLLLGPARDDPLRALRANPGDLTKATWLLLDDLEHGLAKGAYKLLRIDRPDAADHPGAEIFLDALDRRRRRSLEE